MGAARRPSLKAKAKTPAKSKRSGEPKSKPKPKSLSRPAKKPAPKPAPKPAAKSASKRPVKAAAKPAANSRSAYVPSETEPFMSKKMREYFRRRLLEWRAELLRESGQTLESLRQESLNEPDLTDRATLETDRSLELRTRDRYRKLMAKIESALRRIDDGTYGYCEETGEPIGLRRLIARPIATLSLEAQELHERMERTHREE
jgi:DnaK suppressor protein